MIFTRKSQKEVQEDKKPSKKPMVEGIAKKAAAATLIVGMAFGTSACTMSLEDRFDGGDRDAVVDARDGDVDNDLDRDGDVDEDAGVDAGPDEDLDAGVDAGIDEDLDAGIDAGPDEDLDAGVDAGPDEDLDGGDVGADEETVCPGVYDDQTEPQATFLKGEDVPVGGYLIRYVSAAGPGSVNIDIRCEANGADVALNQQVVVGDETAIDVDDKRIRITVHSQNVGRITATVFVEQL